MLNVERWITFLSAFNIFCFNRNINTQILNNPKKLK